MQRVLAKNDVCSSRLLPTSQGGLVVWKGDMIEYSIEQLIDTDQLRQLLESHHSLSGMVCGLFNSNENNLADGRSVPGFTGLIRSVSNAAAKAKRIFKPICTKRGMVILNTAVRTG